VPIQTGGCHCGAIRFEVEGAIEGVTRCNCSICTKKGHLHWIVPRDRFEMVRGEAALETYRFNTRVAKHHFCKVCGIAPFYVARSDPDKIDVNVRCLDGVDPDAVAFAEFDGRNWERAFEAERGHRGGDGA
jgi:hypothetical protein